MRLHGFAAGDTFECVREVDPYRPVYYAGASHLPDACVGYLGDPARLRRIRARFTKPVQVGDVIRFKGRCVAVDGSAIRLEIGVTNQRGEEVLKGAVAEGRLGEG